MFFQLSLFALTLYNGTLVGPFRIAEAEPGHHQVCVRAAMVPDGHFAIAWIDSLQLAGPYDYELDLFIRSFDRDGNPLTDAHKITKLADTNWIYVPCLDMDTLGKTVLVWTEGPSELEDMKIRFQAFTHEGRPMDSAQTLLKGGGCMVRFGLSLANNGIFAFAKRGRGNGVWVQRFDLEGVPQDSLFLAHDTGDINFCYPQTALNDAGDVVVTWLDFRISGESYPRFQVFDAEDESILPWEPRGHLVLDDSLGGTRVEPYWLDNDRFVLFWIDYVWPWRIAGRVFADRGLTRYPIRRLVHDSLAGTWADPEGRFAIALSSDERFAETHTRTHHDPDDYWRLNWQHQAGVLGKIVDNEPWRRTTLFEYSAPWGKDTLGYDAAGGHHFQFPAVGVCDDRLVWVYSRLNTDTIFESFAMITDWDMGVGVAERPVFTQSPIQLSASLNRLSYDVPGEAKLTLYSADGRKVLTETIQGKGTWMPSPPSSQPSSLPSGVYFARVKSNSSSAVGKIVILH